MIGGESARAVEFSRLLHVPDLGSNLFSVLYLTRCRGFNVHIYSDRMDFAHDRSMLFCATIDDFNTAYLDGIVLSPPESAQVSTTSTLALDETLWHRRLAHYHLEGVRKLSQSGAVTGLKLSST